MLIRKIAIIHNNAAERQRLAGILGSIGCEAAAAADGMELLRLVSEGCEAAIIDTTTIDIWDKDFRRRLRTEAPDLPIVLAMKPGRVEGYVALLSTGAWDYLAQPFTEESVGLLLRRLDEQLALLEQNRYLWTELEQIKGDPHVTTRDGRMTQILRQVGKVAQEDAAVLILGEEGTEKESVARLIHRAGARKHRCFVHVDCSVPERELAERLFGRNAVDICRLPRGGTIYFDEVLAMSGPLQARLLRMLEDDCDARLICSSSRDPYEEIEAERFRRDLLFRLNAAQIFLPPLRERPADVPLLAGDLMEQLGMAKPEEGWDELADYDWPGNVSELEAAVRLAALRRSGGRNVADDLLPRMPHPRKPRAKARRRFLGWDIRDL